jgi:tellurite resistance protein TerA
MSNFLNRVNTIKVSKNIINLSKKGSSHSINLKKLNNELSFNLNWNTKVANTKSNNHFFEKLKNKLLIEQNDLDLDLGCMYRLKNGQQGVIQALGNSFGSLSNSPYIMLDGDDRNGENSNGETLKFTKIEEIDLAIVFAFIYEGAPNWKEAKGIATIKQPNNPNIIINLNDDSINMMVGIAILKNESNQLKVEKLEKYYHDHQDLDKDFGFGFKWTQGSK